LAAHVAAALRRDPRGTGCGLTDATTGLPNGAFLALEVAQRRHEPLPRGSRFGLIALRVLGVEQIGATAAERLVLHVARRLAGGAAQEETLVRAGQDLFVLLTPSDAAGALVARWNELSRTVLAAPLQLDDGRSLSVRLAAAHASRPLDGDDLDRLWEVLNERLALAETDPRSVVPFRRHAGRAPA
ncbi:MAG TPA: diguanylate cyclase, partial [Candidatus Polarisedimenticolaceae bacterium]|nr:diguanylate cyclase [Candidatus Polarisedimenticolaceae bacterium]